MTPFSLFRAKCPNTLFALRGIIFYKDSLIFILINCKKITACIEAQKSVEIDNSGSHNIELSINKNTAILNLKNNISKEEFVNPSKPTINSEEIYKVENGNTIKETGKKQQKQNINTKSYSISK